MTLDELRDHLESLPLGDEKALTWAQFEAVFADSVGLGDRQLAAISLAEACSCRLLFRQSEEPYLVFTRRQCREDVRSTARVSPPA